MTEGYEYIRPDGPFAMLCPSDRVMVLERQISCLNATIARLQGELVEWQKVGMVVNCLNAQGTLAEVHKLWFGYQDATAEVDSLKDELAELHSGKGSTFRVNADGQVEQGPGVDWRQL